MSEKTLLLGERRRITLEVWMSDGSAFQPTDCTWQLFFGSTVESEGVCEAEEGGKGWRLTCEVQPQKRVPYKLQYSFAMGTEIVKKTVSIKVT